MVFGARELPHRTVLEHGSTRTGRWLRGRRIRLALWLALIEGLLVVLGAIPWWLAFLVALGVIAFHFSVGRDLASDAAREVSWVGAASQVVVFFIPALVLFVGALALVAVGVLAVVAVIALLAGRR